jgi:hypothetical protein
LCSIGECSGGILAAADWSMWNCWIVLVFLCVSDLEL